jgi:hypothetical protein
MPDYESYSSKEASVKEQIAILYKIKEIDAVIKSSEEL